MFNIVGVDSSIGCSPHCFKPCEKPEDEAAIVKVYREAGGIPFCKTAIPQTLLAFECANPIFGVSTNPYASTRTCGGSSGGEGALIALQGSPLGWGTDSECSCERGGGGADADGYKLAARSVSRLDTLASVVSSLLSAAGLVVACVVVFQVSRAST